MRTHPHLIKQTIDPRLINEINKRTQSNSEKLSNSDKLTYINDNYCEITRNYTSFYGMNMLSIVLFLPIVILCFASVLFFIYDITFNFERYLDTWRYRADSELMLHIAYCAIFFHVFCFCCYSKLFYLCSATLPNPF
ncbi:hypothetical protein HmCmsJML203_00817 [Escherichia coli]|nr:hypothetical protein HmCmsJML203_00817 [Escherichia coli]